MSSVQDAKKLPVASAAPASANVYPFYAWRIWYGMTFSTWFRIFAANRFAISPTHLPRAVRGLIISILNSTASVIQTLIFSKRIRRSVLEHPPIFIIGHWRTGTTHLHEMLSCDERFIAPNTLECFVPGQCLVMGRMLRLVSFLLPEKRPMDNMLLGWDQPQEDEFALLNMGLGSPYDAMLFPNRRRVHHKFLNMTDVSAEQRKAWTTGLVNFLQQVNYRGIRQAKPSIGTRSILLKSPTHTARVRTLRQMFPGAKFIHVVRDPFEVFASTIKLWRGLYETQGCQRPDFGPLSDGVPDIEQYVLDTMDLLYRDFFAEVAEIPEEDFCQVRYEDLVRKPIEEVSRLYDHLRLGSIETMRPRLEAHLRTIAEYKTNEHRIPPERKAEVSRRWGWYIDRFGYLAPLSV